MGMAKLVGTAKTVCSTVLFSLCFGVRYLLDWFWIIYVGFVSAVILIILNL